MAEVDRCVIIGASPDTDVEFIRRTVCKGDYVLCADGGYHFAQQAGVPVHLVVGDFDSGAEPSGIETVRYPVEKDYTDLELTVLRGMERGFRRFLILGGTGGRLPHTLANILLMFRFARKGVQVSLADPEMTAFVLTVPGEKAQIPPGITYSVFSVGGDALVSEIGAKYPLDHYRLSGVASMGVSNESLQGSTVLLHEGQILIITEP